MAEEMDGMTNGATPSTPRPRAIDQIRSAYYRTRHRMEVAAWADDEGKPLEVFFTAVTPAEVAELNKRMEVLPGSTAEDRHIAMLLMKARDDVGKPLFQPGDAPALKTESFWGTLIDVVNEMYALGTTPTLAAAKELLTKDQALAFRVKLAAESGRSVEEIDQYSLHDLTLLAAYELLMDDARTNAEAQHP